MSSNIFDNDSIMGNGIPLDNIVWENIPGNPFGRAGNFNAIVFGDANNIVDMKGAFAVGGSFYSPRGLSLNFGQDPQAPEYTPDNIGFLVGGNVAMNGSLVVNGHVVVNGGFRAARGSTFLIGKDGNPEQDEDLTYLYESNRQSQYWMPSDRGSHYIISSYDVPHYLPANRIDADVTGFFQDAKASIENYKGCIEELPVNGVVEEDFHEWVLVGDDPELNVFVLNRRPSGLINKGIRFDVPDTSTIVVRLQTGSNAHLQYGLLGDESQASRTLYVFEDATNIYMEVPADIWGSFLAPNAMLHGHQTGGHITGNLALNAFAVSANSGFEFHLPVFDGQVFCEDLSDIIYERPMPEVPVPIQPEPIIEEPVPIQPEPIIEEPVPVPPEPIVEAPRPIPQPTVPLPRPARPPRQERPIPELPSIPRQEPCPECPQPQPCPECPQPRPCPDCPQPQPCPECPQPQPRPCPVCPQPRPCPECPQPQPCPECPQPRPCPECPQPRPCPECPQPQPCPECPECLIEEGIISGCIWGCQCCKNHGWLVELYDVCGEYKELISCVEIEYYGCFEFCVPYDGYYTLKVSPTGYRRNQSYFYRRGYPCQPIMSLNNIGVSNFYI